MPITKISKTTIEESLLKDYGMFRNVIVNGDMEVRFAGDTKIPTCWQLSRNSTADANASLATTDKYNPSYPIRHALRIEVTTADTSITSSNYFALYQAIEGIRHRLIKDKPNVLSFYARTNKPGTYCIGLRASQKYVPSFVSEVSITSSTIFERYEIPIPCVDDFMADEDDWPKHNVPSLEVFFMLMAGDFYHTTPNVWSRQNKLSTANQINFVDSVGNWMEITGIQLEAGVTATPFETLGLDVNSFLCSRFYQKIDMFWRPAVGLNSTTVSCGIPLNFEMRGYPTITCESPVVWVNNNNLNASFVMYNVSWNYLYFGMVQTSISIVRHQAYFVKGTLYIDCNCVKYPY